MNPLRFVVDAFVNTFGITRPTREQETRMGWAILAMLVAVLALLVGVFLVVRSMLMH